MAEPTERDDAPNDESLAEADGGIGAAAQDAGTVDQQAVLKDQIETDEDPSQH